MAASPQFVGTARTAHRRLVNADGTGAFTLLTMGANGGLIEGLFLTSNDTTSRWIRILLGDGTTDVFIDEVQIPAASASLPIVQVNLMNPDRWVWLDLNNIKWVLAANRLLKVQMVTAVTALFETSVICNYGEF